MNKDNKSPKQINKLTVEITDEKALAEAFPELVKEETTVVRKVDRSALYPLAKAYHDLGRQVPGVKAYYAATETGQGAAEGTQDGGCDTETASVRPRAKGAA